MGQFALVVPDVGWRVAYRTANLLLRLGVPVRWTRDAASMIVDARGQVTHLPPGSFLLGEPDEVARRATDTIRTLLGQLDVRAVAGEVRAGSSLRLQPARVAVYGGGGAPFHHLSALRLLGFDADPIMPAHIHAGDLAHYTAMAMPGGGWDAMQGQLAPLGPTGARAIAAFVRHGGLYLGSCAGAYNAAVTPASFQESCPVQQDMQLINARIWNTGDAAWGGLQSPGIGVVAVEGAREGHPVLVNLPTRFRLTHYNGPIFAPVDGVIPGASSVTGLARFSGLTPDFTSAEDFLGDGAPGPRLMDRAIAAGLFSVVHGELDAGSVLLCGSHPEFGHDLSLADLEDGALLLANAVLWHTATHPVRLTASDDRPLAWPATSTSASAPRAHLPVIARQVSEVEMVSTAHPWWLEPRHSMSLFGRLPSSMWDGEVAQLLPRLGRIDAAMDRVDDLARRIREVCADVPPMSRELERVARDMQYRADPASRQDGGYRGIGALLEEVSDLLRQATQLRASAAPMPPPSPYHAYQDAWRNPYHLVAGSYLAASGLLTGAELLLQSDIVCLEDALLMRGRGSSH